uniref:Putative disease resistance protein RGA3 n=1 Tax=Davidia involucrata TaxID=16924 RepID=A0A5B6YHC2_DAVIN
MNTCLKEVTIKGHIRCCFVHISHYLPHCRLLSSKINNMAESFAFSIAEKVLGKLGSLALQEIYLAYGFKNELEKIEETLTDIKAVLLDAEEQQEKDHRLSVWLGKLKDVFYDADDVIDEFECEALRQQVVNRGSIIRKVRHFFSYSNPLVFRFRMGHKIKEVRERLDKIALDKTKFNLMVRVVDGHSVVHREREMTHSFVHASDIIGRDQDKEKIVQLLMRSNDHENVSVIPIVGIAGLGKTALAKIVYNDEKVVKHFQLRMWVCVSDDFDMKRLVTKIINSATGMNCDNLDIEQLQNRLRDTLGGQKYLLILDDVWNQDRVKWIGLRDLLIGGANGSKIVVTTRAEVVASIMGSGHTYSLDGLPLDKCLSLLVKWAFREGEDKQYSNLLKMGEEIVKKCKGVPLAVRTLGSFLYMKTDERDWLFVRDNEIWKFPQKEGDILPALKLSYDQLPFYLKQCFAFCSIYAKDHEFDSFALIQRWMAQGFIQSLDQNQELEDIGERYLHELISRSFFQDVVDCGYFLKFKMHDLVHDLALSVAQPEYAVINIHTPTISKKVRHVSFCDYDSPSEVPSSLIELKNLRSIYFQFEEVGPTSKSFVDTCVSRFNCLRMLTLSDSCFEALPSSIRHLKHLRYLDLCDNHIIKSFPNSICKLQSLQTLIFVNCMKLEKLPRDFGDLISLRYLKLTTQMKCLSAKRIGSLTSLRFLQISHCGNLESLFDDGMQCLTTLRTLVIHNCERLVSLSQGLRYLTTLENLIFIDCKELNLMDDREGEDIQRGLRSLRSLVIEGVPKLVVLSGWLQGAADTLRYICIEDCHNFTTLPKWLEDLKSLQKLKIYGCPKLTSLPEGMHRLTTLREIRINGCPELIVRCNWETGKEWNKIAHVPEIYLDDIKIYKQ